MWAEFEGIPDRSSHNDLCVIADAAAERDATIAERDETIAAQAAAISERDTHLADRATEIAFPEMQLLATLMEKTPLLSQPS